MATQAEIAVLRGTATQVKNESQVGGNTAGRVGGLFEGIVDALPSDEVIDGKISEAVADIQPIVIEGNVDNAPDQEDLTSVNQGGTDVLKFKDKTYSPALFSGLGRVYLRKNVVTPENLGYSVNLLTAEMVSQPNTIYHIQYDYDLNGETITLPDGCVLEFDGGSIKNGTLVGTQTSIKAEETAIFKDIFIDSNGTWNVSELYSKWFESTDESLCSTIDNLLNMNNEEINTNIFIRGNYDYVPSHDYGTQGVKSNTIFYVDGTITNIGQQNAKNLFDLGAGTENVSFYGGTFIGNLLDTDTASSPNIENGHCFMMRNAKNIKFDGCYITKFTGDGICISSYDATQCEQVEIINCTIEKVSRNGITIIAGKNITINNVIFKDITRRSPFCAIDVEPNFNTQNSECVEVINCSVTGCTNGILFSNTKGATLKNFKVSNCNVNVSYSSLNVVGVKNALVENSHIYATNAPSTGSSITISAGSEYVDFINNNIFVSKGISLASEHIRFVGNKIHSEGNMFTHAEAYIEGNVLEATNALFATGARVSSTRRQHCILRNNLIAAKLMVLLNTQYMEMEGNYIKLYSSADIPSYFINGGMYDANSVCIIKKNIFDIDASTRYIQFSSCVNLDFSYNQVKCVSNKPILYTSATAAIPLKNNSADYNDFILPKNFTSAKYTGFNTTTTSANKDGNILMDGTKPIFFADGKWNDCYGFTAALNRGTTAERPTNLFGYDAGFQFFDKTLKKPIFFDVTIGASALVKTNIAVDLQDGTYYGVYVANTLTQGVDYEYETSRHISRRFKAAFRKTTNTEADDADELLIADTRNEYDHVFIKAPDPAVYPYVFFCNMAEAVLVVTAWIKNVTTGWVDATGTAV